MPFEIIFIHPEKGKQKKRLVVRVNDHCQFAETQFLAALKNIYCKKVGGNEKIITPLHSQQKIKTENMARSSMHIETLKWFNPGQDYISGGVCILPGNL